MFIDSYAGVVWSRVWKVKHKGQVGVKSIDTRTWNFSLQQGTHAKNCIKCVIVKVLSSQFILKFFEKVLKTVPS